MKSSNISVVILFYRTPEKVITRLNNYKDFNLYILDQSNDLELKEKVKKIFPKIKYYGVSSENKGFAKGINFLVKKVKTKYFLCTQPDTYISKKSILRLKKTLEIKKDSIISVPRIKQFKNFENSQKNKKIFPVNKILGAIFLAEKNKFKKIGMFDEQFFFYWEDVDLCRVIKKNNFKIYLNMSAHANHVGESSVKENLKSFIIRKVYFKYGELIFQSKYKKLKKIKIIRESIKFSLLAIFFGLTFQFKKTLEMLCFIYAIIKFLLIFKKANKNH